ncbi:TonB-dependent receptor domain-containing protein [Bdellovibrio bacteriovorus]|uniref:TonB-dependent receptor domain-containing protein n=1 Tax=Bdellovibrio bacteriovorus TaxID=959 RepID=UPI0035A6FE5F
MKTTMAFKSLTLVFALSLSGMAWAQEAASEEPASSELDAVVIKDDQELKTRTTLRAERIEQTQAEDIKESLKGVSEVMVGGGQKNAQKVYVRGIEDTQLNITVDGARQSGYLFHHQGRLSVDTELLKKIDVDAGTGNALSGPGALGGAVRFETKDAEDLLLPGQRYGALVKARYATNADEKGASLGFFGKPLDKVSFLLYGNFAESGNYHAGEGDGVAYTAGKPKSGLGKIVFTPSNEQKLTLSANVREDNARRSLRNHFGDLPFNPPNDQEFGNQTYTLQHTYNPATPWVNLRSEVYTTSTKMSQETTTAKSEAEAQSFGGQISNKMDLGSLNSVTVGTDYNVDRSEGHRATGTESETGRIFGLFTQGVYRPAPAWTLTAGLRYDNYDLEDVASEMLNSHHLSPNARVGYQFNPVWSAYASWSQAFKGATPMEAFVMSSVKGVAPVGNLKGTTADTSELGVTAQVLGLTVNTAIYQTVLRDVIQVSTNRTTGIMTRSNAAEDLKFQGVNLNANYEAGDYVIRGGYSHNKSEFGSEPLGYAVSTKGSAFGDRFVFGVDYKLSQYNVLLTWDSLVTMKLTDVPSGAVEQPGYDVHDIAVSWMPNERTRVGISVLNIFDKKYVAQGTPYQVQGAVNPIFEPGRDVRLTASYLF